MIKRIEMRKTTPKAVQRPKVTLFFTNTVMNSSWLYTFKSWTDYLSPLEGGNLKVLPNQTHLGGAQRRHFFLPRHRTSAMPPTQLMSQLLLQCRQGSFHFLCRHWCRACSSSSAPAKTVWLQCIEVRRGEKKWSKTFMVKTQGWHCKT